MPDSIRHPAALSSCGLLIATGFRMGVQRTSGMTALAHAHVLDHAPAPPPRSRAHDVDVAVRIAPDSVTGSERNVAPLRHIRSHKSQSIP